MTHRADHRPFPGLESELDALVASIQAAVRAAVAPVQDLGDVVMATQVGLVRPSFVLVSCRAISGEITDRGRAMAEACELIHYASLLHEKGAGLEVDAEGPWSAKKAILLGDLLLAGAMTRLADHGDSHDVAAVAAITGMLAEGQILELSLEGEPIEPVAEFGTYMDVLERRFGVFLREAGGLGARAGGAEHDDPLTMTLGRLGRIMAEILRMLSDVEAQAVEPPLAKSLLAHCRDQYWGARTAVTALDNLGATGPLEDIAAWVEAAEAWQDRIEGIE